MCFDREIWKRAGEAAERLAFVKREYYKNGIETDYVEAIIYPPKDKADWAFNTSEGYSWLSDNLKLIFKDFGILGGVRVTHMTAVNRNEGATYKEYNKLRLGLPTRIRYNPHIQAIGLRRADWGPSRSKENKWREAGWFVRVLYADGRTDNRAWNSVRRKLSYEMSHAYQGKTESGTTKTFTTLFGINGYNNVRQTVTITKEEELCKCGEQCMLYEEDVPKDVSMIKRRKIEFWLKPGAIDRAVLKYHLNQGELRAEDLTLDRYGPPLNDVKRQIEKASL